jgi:pimeloyl-ACP methyl ester carboxylesterase
VTPANAPTDLVVVLPGITGSQLRRDGKLVWGPSAGAALRAIRTFGRSIKRLQLPDDIADSGPGDGVEPAGLMPDLHVLPGIWTPVKGYDVLLGRLRSLGYSDVSDDPAAPAGNLLPLGYDWRLSNRYTGQWIGSHVERALERWRAQGGRYADARVVFVCHSMGGLVARWYIERCGGKDITRKLITLGTPYRGAARALEQLVNGAHQGLGPFAIDLTRFARSLPSLHQLLPEYACIERDGDLAKTTETTVPELRTTDINTAMNFHAELTDAEAARPDSLAVTHAIIGFRQATATTVRISGGRVITSDTYRGTNLAGDATVPIVGACRADVPMTSPLLRRICDKHGNLQRNKAALDEIEGVLTAQPVLVRADEDGVDVAVGLPELVIAGEELPVSVQFSGPRRASVRLAITDESEHLVEARVMQPPAATKITDLPPGAYTVSVTGLSPGVSPVSSTVLVWDTAQNYISRK